MDANVRIKLKVGEHEFEAEGPPEDVKFQLELWKQMVAGTPAGNFKRTEPHGAAASEKPRNGGAPPEIASELLSTLFTQDKNGELVTLAMLPSSKEKHEEAMLMILFGFRKLLNADEVLVTRLKSAIETSGLVVDRIDRIAETAIREGLVLKGGSGKGGKYRLTNLGMTRATEMVAKVLAQL